MITMLIVAALIGQAPQPEPQTKAEVKPAATGERPKKSPARKVEMFAEPNWVPMPGDRVDVIVDGAPACNDLEAVNEALNAIQANDRAGIEQLLKSKRVEKLAKGTKVLVIANSRPAKVVSAPRFADIVDANRQMQAAMLAPRPDFRKLPVEVRILDGELAGEKRYIPEMYMAKLIPDPDAPQRRAKPRLAKPAVPKPEPVKADRASTLLQSARNLEKSGKVDGAVKFYRQVVKDFPDSAEAKTATERLRSLQKE
jgi:hypothetical protein